MENIYYMFGVGLSSDSVNYNSVYYNNVVLSDNKNLLYMS